MYEILKYTDEVDKSLGITGMSIALMACDGEDYLATVSVEEGESTFDFSPDAFFLGNPRLSAKIAWTQIMKEFHIFSGMVLGNVMCRHIVTKHTVGQEIIDILHDLISEHGLKECSLDDDEIEDMFEKDFQYFYRLFNHPVVSDAAREFATTLRLHRRMTGGEVFENLSRLTTF